ncbi:CMGC family protein kinase [Trichomonas vaginalis G3]|uniref:CMGC family protein kinase n=1 Tax=Trichomonas vaginalis (strain ATCC PRA-98 / G3) TaxID=412133 RepID=A2E1T2_TRIV3|nr:protein serine/threonine kinase protein [Trichomonas vaginalis G3]EAY13411.1 CMGC family protein kinase [Trichomonas vaginalis G3]KAI5528163.1 protein serine/threonine kinase protein [Trichomonas vaginalis G3]|eukprot:XP_001325634.1 CMGC family protein kinase [Trichomonas vaginalis G3]
MQTRIDCLEEYTIMAKVGDGTFSNVFKVKKNSTGEIFAMKVMKKHYESVEEVDANDEIRYMRELGEHQNILQLYDVIFEPKLGRLSLVTDLMEFNLLNLLNTPHFFPDDVLYYSYQLLNGLSYLHSAGFVHRDIKPENILINLRSRELRIGDFGSLVEEPCNYIPGEYITTRWYRAPELLLKCPTYNCAIDVWSVGCVIAEMILKHPLFPGGDTTSQLEMIHNALGAPTAELFETMAADSRYKAEDFQNVTPISLINRLEVCPYTDLVALVMTMLKYNPSDRVDSGTAAASTVFESCKYSKSLSRARVLVKSTPDIGFQGVQIKKQITISLKPETKEAPSPLKRQCVTFPKIYTPNCGKHIPVVEKMPKNRSFTNLDD